MKPTYRNGWQSTDVVIMGDADQIDLWFRTRFHGKPSTATNSTRNLLRL